MREAESRNGICSSWMGAMSKPAVLCIAMLMFSSFAAWAQTPQGRASDIRVIGDFDGDGNLDQAVWRPSDGTWYVVPSSNPGIPIQQQWEYPAMLPCPAIMTATAEQITRCTGLLTGHGMSSRAVIRAMPRVWSGACRAIYPLSEILMATAKQTMRYGGLQTGPGT